MAAILEENAVSFHSFSWANYIKTVPLMVIANDGAPQRMILSLMVNGDCVTTR